MQKHYYRFGNYLNVHLKASQKAAYMYYKTHTYILHASLNVVLTHDNVEANASLPPPLLLLFGNSQMKNMAASHSTRPHVPLLSSSTQLEFVVEDNVEFSSSS